MRVASAMRSEHIRVGNDQRPAAGILHALVAEAFI
jgi:hypothetical protein